jgi:hypothetical protein
MMTTEEIAAEFCVNKRTMRVKLFKAGFRPDDFEQRGKAYVSLFGHETMKKIRAHFAACPIYPRRGRPRKVKVEEEKQ